MRQFFLLIFLHGLLLSPVFAEEFTVTLHGEEWDSLRSGDALLKQPQLAELVQRWSQTPADIIELRYPGGEEGEIWVHELTDWLVALGVPSAAMQSLAGSGTNDTIYLVLIHGSNK